MAAKLNKDNLAALLWERKYSLLATKSHLLIQ